MANETLETIKKRRSCRAYKPEQITDEELNAVLEAFSLSCCCLLTKSRMMLKREAI